MRRTILLLLAAGLFGVFASAAPVISVDQATYVADVQSSSVVSHVFTLTNSGDEELVISDVKPSCSCTTATLARPVLAPGESGSLEARVDTTGLAGQVEKTVEVDSNDPLTPALVLRLTLNLPADTEPAAPVAQSSTVGPGPAARETTPPAIAWPIVLGLALALDVALALLLVLLTSTGA